MADVTDKTQRLRDKDSNLENSPLADAQDTLTRLQNRQQEQEIANDFLDAMDQENNVDRLVEKLAENDCGEALKTTAEDVLERLKANNTHSN